MRHDKPADEAGAVMPIVALLIVILLVFAAFTVDLGAAWAERRQLQSAADAGAMAAVFPPPGTDDTLASIAMDFVDENAGLDVDRDGCSGWSPAAAGVAGTFVLAEPDETNCVWISNDTAGTEMYVAVKVPTQQVPTSFARVIGIDSLPVDAFAVSQIAAVGSAHILPFALKSNPSSNECLGSPPTGLSRDPCSGGATGNYGYLTSWFHGSTELGTVNSCDPGGGPEAKTITEANIAIGTDHPVQNDIKWDTNRPTSESLADADLADECDGKTRPGYIPDSVVFCTECGQNNLHAGLVSNETFGTHGASSRLQQGGGTGGVDVIADTRTVAGSKHSESLVLDNIGLWEYVIAGTGFCEPGAWQVAGGIEATAQMKKCLEVDGHSVAFSDALWSSPRFAVVPELWDDEYPLGAGTKAIKRFSGVYLNATWFNCSAATSANECLVFVDSEGDDQQVFFPGEGDDPGCLLGPSGKCKDPQVQGLSSLVLPIDSVPADVIRGSDLNARLLHR